MASLSKPNSKSLISFSDAIKIQRLDSHTYAANLAPDYCIGTGKQTNTP